MKMLFIAASVLLGSFAVLQARHAMIHATCVFSAGLAGSASAVAEQVAACD